MPPARLQATVNGWLRKPRHRDLCQFVARIKFGGHAMSAGGGAALSRLTPRSRSSSACKNSAQCFSTSVSSSARALARSA